MSFSIRGLFQPGNPEGGVTAEPAPFRAAAGEAPPTLSAPSMHTETSASPFAPGASLFRTVGNEAVQAQPVNAGGSPFSVSSAPTTAAPLTVGDLLPQLPPEMARAGGLDPSQPIAIGPDVIERALKEGQAQIPLFEVFRVCPALFQTPVSPQDPRGVPLPASKLPALIAATTQEKPAPVDPGAVSASPSPFSVPSGNEGFSAPQSEVTAQPPAPEKAVGSTTSALPPRRNGPPPSLHPEGGAPGTPVFPVSPFSAPASEGDSAQKEAPDSASPPSASPFAVAPSHPSPQQPEAAGGGSPFAVAQSPETGKVAAPTPTREPSSQAVAPMPTMASLFSGQQSVSPSSEKGAATPNPGSNDSAPASPFSPPSPVASAPTEAPPVGGAGSPFAAMAQPFGAKPPEVAPAPSPAVQFQAPSPNGPDAAAPSGNPSAPATSPFGTAPVPSNGPEAAANGNVPASTSPFGQVASDPGQPPPLQPTPVTPISADQELPQQEVLRLGLAALVQGYSVAELGFDPVVIPTWITVELRRSDLQQRTTPSGTLVSVGELVDAVTDPGFRNMLASARRDFQIKLNPEVVNALGETTEPAPMSPPSGGSSPSPTPQPTPMVGETAPPNQLGAGLAGSISEAPPMPTIPSFPSAPGLASPGAQGAVPQSESKLGGGTPFGVPAQAVKPSEAGGFDPFAAPESASDQPSSSRGGDWGAPPKPSQVTAEVGQKPVGFSPEPRPESKQGGFSSADLLGQEPKAAPADKSASFFGGEPPEPEVSPMIRPASPPSPPKPAGLQASDARSDQVLLRALLGSDTPELTVNQVVDLTAQLDGVSACVCVKGDEVVAVGSRPGDAAGKDFEAQAAKMAGQVKSMAPLIGIDGAETFTLSVQPRTLTFCFPGTITMGVLHSEAAALGLRDKLTLIARELDRWVA